MYDSVNPRPDLYDYDSFSAGSDSAIPVLETGSSLISVAALAIGHRAAASSSGSRYLRGPEAPVRRRVRFAEQA